MKRYYLFFVFLLFGNVELWAQGQPSFGPKVVFPSPQAAQLGKFGGYEINHSTGSANIAIPLYTLKEGSISIPLSLTYSYAGCRPSDQPGWVGLGWSFQPGGVITRTIKGVADEKQNQGYLARKDKVKAFYNKYASNSLNVSITDHLDVIIGDTYDTQPDQFSFQFGNYSGQFVFNSEGKPTLLVNDDQKLRFSYETKTDNLHTTSSDYIISKWTIITEDGTKYEFEDVEYSGNTQSVNDFKPSAWYLSRITSATGEVVDFDYTDPQPYLYSRRQQSGIFQTFNTSSMEGVDPTSYPTTFSEEVYLTAIRSANWKVEFQSEANPTILNYANGRRLLSFNVYNPISTKLTSFSFNYADVNAYKLTLLQVNQTDQPPYVFEYASFVPQLLGGGSMSVDHWGFFNGQNNKSIISYFQSPDLEPRLEETKRGALTKITYPTKGFTTFDYELHDYSFVQQQKTDKEKFILTPYRFTFGKNEHGSVELNQIPFVTFTDSTTVFFTITNNSQSPAPTNCQSTGVMDSYRFPPGSYSAYDILRKSYSYPCNQPEAMQMTGYKVVMDVKIRKVLAKNTSFYGGLRIKSITDNPVVGLSQTRSFYYENEDDKLLSSGFIKAEPLQKVDIDLSRVIPNYTDKRVFIYRSGSFNPMALFPVRYNRVREVTNEYEVIRSFTMYENIEDFYGRLSYFTVKESMEQVVVRTLPVATPLGDMETYDYLRFLPKKILVKDLSGKVTLVTDFDYKFDHGKDVSAIYLDYLFQVKVPTGATNSDGSHMYKEYAINYYKLYDIITGFSLKTKETTSVYNSN